MSINELKKFKSYFLEIMKENKNLNGTRGNYSFEIKWRERKEIHVTSQEMIENYKQK